MTHVKHISTREILKDERKRKIDFQQVREVIKTDDRYKLFKELRGHRRHSNVTNDLAL